MKTKLILGLLLIVVLVSGCSDLGLEKKEISMKLNTTELTLDFSCEYETYSEQKQCFKLMKNIGD